MKSPETVRGTRLALLKFHVSDYLIGNGTFPSSFPGQEGQNAHCSQTSWSEEQPQESPPTWDTAACVGSKVTGFKTQLRLVK